MPGVQPFSFPAFSFSAAMSLLSALLALARAIPALESLFRAVVAERDKERERAAAARLAAKDDAVDAAIDAAIDKPLNAEAAETAEKS